MDLTSLLLVTLLLALLLAAFKLYRSKIQRRALEEVPESPPSSNKLMNAVRSLTNCHSSDCYRCTNNRETLQTALTKLSYYAQNSDVTALDIQNISADIKKSVDHLKYRNKPFEEQLDSFNVINSSPVIFKMSGLREYELWYLDDFPALQLLEKQFKQIELEFMHLYQSPLPETRCLWKTNSTDSGKWEIVQLVDQGRETKAAKLCPLTMEVLKKIPYFICGSIFGDASFSVVHSNTHIATHCGSTNCRIRCHLGLKVPENDCTLQVGDKICHWQEGKIICFNDAFPHSVHHRGSEGAGMRAVFILDLWHPDITESQRNVLTYAFSA